MSSIKKIIIATGGTGGHIFPAISLANYLESIGYKLSLTTDERGLKFINTDFLKKTEVIKSSLFSKKEKNLFFFKILCAIYKSLVFLFKTRPQLIFGMGGYASFPICFAGIILRIPFIVYESKSYRWGKQIDTLHHLPKKIFVSYEDIHGINLKYKEKILKVGNILRENHSTLPKLINLKMIGI